MDLHLALPRRRRPALARAAAAAAAVLALQVCVPEAASHGLAWLPARAWGTAAGAQSAARNPREGVLGGGLAEASPGSESLAGERDCQGRRAAVAGCAAALLAAAAAWSPAARALVKGNAPPSNYGASKYSKAACKTVGECQEIGRVREDQEFGKAVKYQMTSTGARYYDMVPGSKEAGVLDKGGLARLRYRVMRQGKRSQDGLSGEASTIFSLGYGEDEGPKDAVLTAKVGEGRFVLALEEGLVGMAVGGKRRVQVRPENGLGWNKEGKCAEEIAAVGVLAGLPSGGAQNEETCLDDSKLPLPVDFASKRRFSRRFDESLIVEVELVGLGSA